MYKITVSYTVLLIALAAFSCACRENPDGKISSIPEKNNFMVTWEANRENSVNRPGGGYKVYYSTNKNFSITTDDVEVIDVPYSEGQLAPTSTGIHLDPGTWYLKIVAYSSMNGQSLSAPSDELEITVE